MSHALYTVITIPYPQIHHISYIFFLPHCTQPRLVCPIHHGFATETYLCQCANDETYPIYPYYYPLPTNSSHFYYFPATPTTHATSSRLSHISWIRYVNLSLSDVINEPLLSLTHKFITFLIFSSSSHTARNFPWVQHYTLPAYNIRHWQRVRETHTEDPGKPHPLKTFSRFFVFLKEEGSQKGRRKNRD